MSKIKGIFFNGTNGQRVVGYAGVEHIEEVPANVGVPYHFLIMIEGGVRERLFNVTLVEYFPNEGPGQVRANESQVTLHTSDMITCPVCNGNGIITTSNMFGTFSTQHQCDRCSGSGVVQKIK